MTSIHSSIPSGSPCKVLPTSCDTSLGSGVQMKLAVGNELHALRRKGQKAKWYQKKRRASKKQICSEADTVSDDLSTPTSQASAQSHRYNTPLCQPSTSFRSSNPSAQSSTPSHRSSTPSSRSSMPSRQCSLFSQPRNLSHQSTPHLISQILDTFLQMTVTGPFCPLHLVVVPILLLHSQLL